MRNVCVQVKRADRARIDTARIRAAAAREDTELIERLLSAAMAAMARGTANHAEEWLPAGLIKTDGKLSKGGKLRDELIDDELRARYDALLTTSTCVERLHAIGRDGDLRVHRQRGEHRAGIQVAKFNDLPSWLRHVDGATVEKYFNSMRPAARAARRTTLKDELVAEGRVKREGRDAELQNKRQKKLKN